MRKPHGWRGDGARRDCLPEVALPLGPDAPAILVDLQAVFTRAYDEGPTESLDYASEPNPPLSEADALWISKTVLSN